MRVARRDRLEDGLTQCEPRLAVVLDQGHRQEGLVARLTLLVLPRPCSNDTLRLDDLAKDAPQPMSGTLLLAHAEAEGAARSDVHLAVTSRQALRAPPARRP